jgi:hypothetical protein
MGRSPHGDLREFADDPDLVVADASRSKARGSGEITNQAGTDPARAVAIPNFFLVFACRVLGTAF